MDNEKLIKDNLLLIYKIAGTFYNAEKDDLVQAGMLGLVKAYKKYNCECGVKFSTYAHDYIFGEMYQVASKRLVKVNKDVIKFSKYLEKVRYEEAQKIGKIPTNYELSQILDLPLETLDYASSALNDILSLDNDSNDQRNYYETIECKETLSIDDRYLLHEGINRLPEKEKVIIQRRYLCDETQSDVARNLNMTQVMVSRIEKKAVERMRELIR